MVCTELKMLQTFEEFRADLLGQMFGSENAARYAGATRLQILCNVIARIPKVTSHLPDGVLASICCHPPSGNLVRHVN